MRLEAYKQRLADVRENEPSVTSRDGFTFTLSVLGHCIWVTLPDGRYGWMIEGDRMKPLKKIWVDIKRECAR